MPVRTRKWRLFVALNVVSVLLVAASMFIGYRIGIEIDDKVYMGWLGAIFTSAAMLIVILIAVIISWLVYKVTKWIYEGR